MKNKILIPLILLTAVLFAVGCSNAATDSAGNIDFSNTETSNVGEEVVAGDVVWKVTKVENLGDKIQSEGVYTLASEEGNFINIDFEVSNTGTETKQIFDLKVIDDQGRAFTICIEAYGVLGPYTNDACTLATINPGENRTFNTTFDTVADFDMLVLEVTDLKLPAGVTKYIDLGL